MAQQSKGISTEDRTYCITCCRTVGLMLLCTETCRVNTKDIITKDSQQRLTGAATAVEAQNLKLVMEA